MVDRKVKLCDECELKVAKGKCMMCGKDLCDTCKGTISQQVVARGQPFRENVIWYCKEHRDAIIDSISKPGSDSDAIWDELDERLNDYFKKKIMLDELSYNGEENSGEDSSQEGV